MNSYRRARGRPRRRSVSFRALGWVLSREAALQVAVQSFERPDVAALRRWLAGRRTDGVRAFVADALAREPRWGWIG